MAAPDREKQTCRGRGNSRRSPAASRLCQGPVLRPVPGRPAAALSRRRATMRRRPTWSQRLREFCAAKSIPSPSTARPRFRSASSPALAGSASSARACRRTAAGLDLSQAVVLPPAGSARRPLRQHGAVRQRPPLDRPAGARAVRHRGAASGAGCPSWPAASGSAPSP